MLDKIPTSSIWLFIVICVIVIFFMQNRTNTKYVTENLFRSEENLSKQLNTIRLEMHKNALLIAFVQSIIMKTDKQIDRETAFLYSEEIISTSDRYQSITPMLLTSVIYQESRFNTYAVSPAGAQGLGQIFPETGEWICSEWRLPYNDSLMFNPIINIRVTAWFLDWLYHNPGIANKDNELRLAYYNGGGRQAYRYMLHRRTMSGGKLTEEEQSYVNRLSPETKNYVTEVMERTNKYQKILEQS